MEILETKSLVETWLDINEIKNYSIRDDLTVDVAGDVNFGKADHFAKLKSFPVQFGIVKGDFICHHHRLISLKGCPHEVGGNFDVSYNYLSSLKEGPTTVAGHYRCEHNDLKDLVGAPSIVGRGFDCTNNNLLTLEGSPELVGGSFVCLDCGLRSLKGAPNKVGEKFLAWNNQLKSLDGLSCQIGQTFDISGNPITNLGETSASVSKRFIFGDGDVTYDSNTKHPFTPIPLFNNPLKEFPNAKFSEGDGYFVEGNVFNDFVMAEIERRILDATVKKANISIDIGSSKPGAAVEQIRKARSEQGLTLAPVKAQPSTTIQPTQAKSQQRTFKI